MSKITIDGLSDFQYCVSLYSLAAIDCVESTLHITSEHL